MANSTCVSTLKLCGLRAGRLTSAGILSVGTTNLYTTDASILLGFNPNVPDTERFEQIDGCGNQCVLYIGSPKSVSDADLTLNLCRLDSELIEMLAGGSVITSSYNTIGYLAPTDTTLNANGVFLEAWTYAWNGRSRALLSGVPAYWRFVFPLTRWTVGEITLENGISTIPLTGSATPNSAYGTGLTALPFPTSVGNSVYGWALVNSIPTAACGYTAIV